MREEVNRAVKQKWPKSAEGKGYPHTFENREKLPLREFGNLKSFPIISQRQWERKEIPGAIRVVWGKDNNNPRARALGKFKWDIIYHDQSRATDKQMKYGLKTGIYPKSPFALAQKIETAPEQWC